MDFELVKFRREISCSKCNMLLVRRGTFCAVLDESGDPVYMQGTGGLSADELEGVYEIRCDCRHWIEFRTPKDADPYSGTLERTIPVPVRRVI